jgi:hypothetical protein
MFKEIKIIEEHYNNKTKTTIQEVNNANKIFGSLELQNLGSEYNFVSSKIENYECRYHGNITFFVTIYLFSRKKEIKTITI